MYSSFILFIFSFIAVILMGMMLFLDSFPNHELNEDNKDKKNKKNT